MPRFFLVFSVSCLLLVSGCSYFRLPVLQGNIVDYEKAEKLRVGMTPSQVEFLLGTPLVRDSFGAPRWDYVIYYRSPDADVLQKNMSVYFENDQVSQIEGREELLADWRKKQAVIKEIKQKKESLENPQPGELPADTSATPASDGSARRPDSGQTGTGSDGSNDQNPANATDSSGPSAEPRTDEQESTRDNDYPADMSQIYEQS